MLPNFSYVRPASLKEAIRQLSSEGAVVHAGGTDLLGCLRDRVFSAQKVVSITGLKELRGIRRTADGGLGIGALTTLSEIAEDPRIKENYAALAQGASEAASPQLRRQGTLGGNLCQKPRCWYYRGEFHCLRKGGEMCYAVAGENPFHCLFGGEGCYIVHPSDTAPPLIILGARIRIAGPQGTKTVSVEKFYVPPAVDPRRETILERNEVVTDILLPPLPKDLRSSYRKVKARRSWDFALAGVALGVRLEEGRVGWARAALSGAAPVPWRSREIEKVVTGSRLDEETILRAAEAGVKDANPLAQNEYKIPLFRGLIEEQLRALIRT